MKKKQIVIVGGGFGGIYTAMYLDKQIKKRKDFEVTIINRENYFVYQPMLAEIVGGSVGMLDTVSSIARLAPESKQYVREIAKIDLEKKSVEMIPVYTHDYMAVSYDYLVLALGNVTDFRGAPGLHEHALPFKNLADALKTRNRIIDVLASASTTTNETLRKEFLTFVIGGGGYSGTEVVAEINDLVRTLVKDYPRIDPKEVRVFMVHSKDRLMERELNESLSRYAEKILRKRGVEFRFGLKLESATNNKAVLSNGEIIPTRTVISTVPSSPNPLIEALDVPKEKGKVKTDRCMQVEGHENVFAIGDCASIPLDDKGAFCPPTAQFAVREAKILAYNILQQIDNKEKKPFFFKSLGSMGALGHHNAVGEIFGKFKVSGIFAWFMWRTIYWYKLPGFSRKIKVAASWFLDFFIPQESIMLKTEPSQAMAQLHFEAGDIVFHQGDIGDYLYNIVEGTVDVIIEKDGKEEKVASLSKGEFFGEMALLNERTRTATIKCATPVDLLALRKSDFGVLVTNFSGLKEQFVSTEEERKMKF